MDVKGDQDVDDYTDDFESDSDAPAQQTAAIRCTAGDVRCVDGAKADCVLLFALRNLLGVCSASCQQTEEGDAYLRFTSFVASQAPQLASAQAPSPLQPRPKRWPTHTINAEEEAGEEDDEEEEEDARKEGRRAHPSGGGGAAVRLA
jgi:hypothetical protein